MFKLVVICCSLFLTVSVFAKDVKKARKPNSNGGFSIGCEGVNAKGIKIGLSAEFDPADRIVSMAVFENESTGAVDIKTLSAPSHFVKTDAQGKLVVFGLKTFNDGLEEDMSILFVEGLPRVSALKLGQGADNLATKQISCRVLK